jgi:hypothetical protein
MGSIDKIFLENLKENYQDYNIFIETGIGYGDTILNIEKEFKYLYTIEVQTKLIELVKSKYEGNKIEFILGDSQKVFDELLPKINENVIIFLDAHYSGGDTGYVNKHVPLYEELDKINRLLKTKAILIIDDFRLFQQNRPCWKNITKEGVIKVINNRISDIYHLPSNLCKDDRLVIHINPI